MQTRADRIAWGAVALAAAIGVLLCVHRVVWSPEGRLIAHAEDAPWVVPQGPVTARIQQWGRTEAPEAAYESSFVLREAPARARVEARAFGELALFLNGERVSLSAGDARGGDGTPLWRRFARAEVSDRLRAGRNAIRAKVRNAQGPPLLALRVVGPDGETLFSTRDAWSVRVDDGPVVPAVRASDRRLHPESVLSPEPLRALWDVRGSLGVLLAAGALTWWWVRRRAGAAVWERLPALALAAVGLGWLLLFALVFLDISYRTGFDAGNHVVYFDLVQREWRVPTATEGWSTYHPPLFYFASAALVKLFDLVGTPQVFSLKLLPFLAGLGNVVLAFALARRMLPGRPAGAAVATLFAGTLPMNLYMAAYYGNEGLHAFLSGGALLVAVWILLDGRTGVSPARIAAFSLLAGLALLTKFTALVVAGIAGLAVAARIAASHRSEPAALAGRLALLVLPLALVCGWFYARNVLLYGQPLVGNWDLPAPDKTWWSPPGFHTPGYYLCFGESLVHPFYSGIACFWDALYTSLWGDGFLGGRGGYASRHPHWSYVHMAAGYALALPATLLLAAGCARGLRLSLRDPDPGRRAALGLLLALLAAMGFAIFYTTLALPYLGQARASYALALAPALALFFAHGVLDADAWLARRAGPPAQVALAAYLSALFGVFYLSFLL